jgi:tetratricopeptide (TPR) repeat protein
MVRTIRKKYIIIFFIWTVTFASIFAGQAEELFLRGNKYYAEKDYNNALETYDMIDQKGCAVLYNMGNCYYRQENYPYALVYWARAEIGANH